VQVQINYTSRIFLIRWRRAAARLHVKSSRNTFRSQRNRAIKSSMRLRTLVCAFAILAATTNAAAHIQLVTPTPRVPNFDELKMAPCGGAVWGANGSTTVAPGQTITLKFYETISHPGVFRVAMDMDGDNDFTPIVSAQVFDDYKKYFQNQLQANQLPAEVVAPVTEGNMLVLRNYYGLHDSNECPSNMTEQVNGSPACVWSIDVTVPNQTCDRCTLQLIQLMAESSRTLDSGFYYHCADIQISGQPANNTGGSGAGGGASAGGSTGSGGASANSGGAPAAVGSGGVSNSTGGTKGAGGSSATQGAGGGSVSASGGTSTITGTPKPGTSSESSGCTIQPTKYRASWLSILAAFGMFGLLRRRSNRV